MHGRDWPEDEDRRSTCSLTCLGLSLLRGRATSARPESQMTRRCSSPGIELISHSSPVARACRSLWAPGVPILNTKKRSAAVLPVGEHSYRPDSPSLAASMSQRCPIVDSTAAYFVHCQHIPAFNPSGRRQFAPFKDCQAQNGNCLAKLHLSYSTTESRLGLAATLY